MKIRLAKTAGFCMGVKRAMETTLDVAKRSSGPVFTFGPLIHNSQVIAELEAKGIKSVDDISAISSGTVIIRAHGVTPATFDRLKAQAAEVVDGTCPLVAKVQNKIKEQADKGYAVIIVGDAGHAEVIGLMGYAGEKGFVVSSDEDLAKLPALDKVAVVSQTTQSEEKFARISGELKKRYSDCEVFNTICGSTKSRQAETMELAKAADVIVTVGDRTSANTCRLAELARENCRKAVHVESEDELRREDLAGAKLVAVTAGASTPSWLIERVVRRVQAHGRPAVPVLVKSMLATGSMFVHANLWAGIGAAALSVTACVLLGIKPTVWLAALAGLYIFSMHTINRFSDPTWQNTWASLPAAGAFRRWGWLLMVAAFLAMAGVLAISVVLGPVPSLVAIAAVFAGCMYSLRILPKSWTDVIGFARIRDLPGSKDISTAIGWTLSAAVLPFLTKGWRLSAQEISVFAFCFLLALARSVLLGVREVHRDRMIGKETFFNVLGRSGTKVLLGIVVALLIGTLIVHWRLTGSQLPLIMLTVTAYASLYCISYHYRILPEGPVGEAIVDGQFLLAGVISLAWVYWPRVGASWC